MDELKIDITTTPSTSEQVRLACERLRSADLSNASEHQARTIIENTNMKIMLKEEGKENA